MIITQKREDLAAHIARHLDLPPDEPNEWSVEIIERIMSDMDEAAQMALEMACRKLMTKSN